MGLLTEKRTERIDLGDGDWATIAVSLDTKLAATVTELKKKGEADQLLGLLEAIIVEWSLDIEISRESVGLLDPAASAAVLDAFNKRVEGLDPKASSSPSRRTSRATRRHPTKTP